MEKDDFSERLKRLEDRFHAAHSQGGSHQSVGGRKFTQTSIAWRMVTELVVGMLLGMAIGYGLDSLLGTMPWFLVLFSLLGFAAGVRTMLRTAEEMKTRKDTAAPGAPADGTPGRPGKE